MHRKIIFFLVIIFISSLLSMLNANNYIIEKVDLNNNIIDKKFNSISQDETGFIWIASNNGIIRYDGLNFNLFSPKGLEKENNTKNNFRFLLPYSKEKILTASVNGEVYIFNTTTEEFSRIFHVENIDILDIKKFSENKIHILTSKGLYVIKSLQTITYYPLKQNISKYHNQGGAMTLDSQGNLWIIKNGMLYHLNFKTNKINRALKQKLPSNLTDINFIHPSKLLIGSLLEGLFVLDLPHNQIKNIKLPYYKAISIGSNHITKLHIDKSDNCWIGSQYSLKMLSCNDLKQKQSEIVFSNELLIDDRINYIFEDKDDVLWVITNESEIKKIIPKSKAFNHYSYSTSLKPNITDNKVNAFHQDSYGKIWIGTRSGITKFDPMSKKFSPLNHNEFDIANLNEVSSFFEISKDSILISTWNRLYAFSLYDFHNNNWSHFKNPKEQQNVLGGIVSTNNKIVMASFGEGLLYKFNNSLKNSHNSTPESLKPFQRKSFYCMLIDNNQEIWLSDYKNGLILMNLKTQENTIFKHNNDSNSLSDNMVYSIYQDKQNRIWIGTKNGLNLYNPQSKNFIRIFPEKWKKNNIVKAITQDLNGNIWFSQENRITRYNPDNMQLMHINIQNHIPNISFQGKSAYCDRSGTLYFGTLADGFITIDANAVKEASNINLTISGLQINDIQVQNGSMYYNSIILSKSLHATKRINFSHKVNKIAIDLSLLSYTNNSGVTYAYKFDNLNSDWTYSNSPTITLTNLPPGTYKLLTKAANDLGIWTNTREPLVLHIQTPPWQSWWAFTLYTLLIIALIAIFLNNYMKKIRLSNELKMERFEKEQIKIIDSKKVRFFTNISHEFRTPITLISNYVHKIITNTQPNNQYYEELKMVHYNSEQLLLLVNQLLDYRKLEENQIKFNPQKNDLITECFRNYQQFEGIAKSKNIDFFFESETENLFIWFDVFILDRILFNLLSNAFKFTDQGSWIKLSIRVSENNTVLIQVQDTGIGISDFEQTKIFDNFYQSPSKSTKNSGGTGIGLAFSKQLANVHNGKLMVKSEKEIGSTFTFSFPIFENTVNENNWTLQEKKQPKDALGVTINSDTTVNPDKTAVILIVEDNLQLRSLITNELAKKFIVKEAENGQQGIDIITEFHPDLIISDVQMPLMNGYEMCRIIKQDISLSHIPVILLTAKVLTQNKIEGYNSGSDDYIEKPFSLELLMLKISNILETRRNFRALFGSGKIQIQQGLTSALDDEFFKSVFKIISNNYSDSSFDVEQFCSLMKMNQNTIYRKIKAVTGLSISEFIRVERLKKAADMIKENRYTIQEVCFKVGFSSPAYFTQCFKKQYGVIPKEY